MTDQTARERFEKAVRRLARTDGIDETQIAEVLRLYDEQTAAMHDMQERHREAVEHLTRQRDERPVQAAMVAACCGRPECGGECGNEWQGMRPAQPAEPVCELQEWKDQADRAGKDLALALDRAKTAESQRDELLAVLRAVERQWTVLPTTLVRQINDVLERIGN